MGTGTSLLHRESLGVAEPGAGDPPFKTAHSRGWLGQRWLLAGSSAERRVHMGLSLWATWASSQDGGRVSRTSCHKRQEVEPPTSYGRGLPTMAECHFCNILLGKKSQSPDSRGGDTDSHLLMGRVF